MYSWTFIIRGLKICSINNAYATRDYAKSIQTVRWLHDFKIQMLSHSREVQQVKTIFDHRKHFLEVSYLWFLPKKELFTQKETINLRAGDWSNFPKIPDDLMLNQIFDLEDGFVCKGSVLKLPSKTDEHFIKVIVSIHTFDVLLRKADVEFPSAFLGPAIEIP